MKSAAVTALVVGSALLAGAAAGSPRAPAAQPATAAFSYWGGPFDQVFYGGLEWGDYDGDDDLDLLLNGHVGEGVVTWIYRNDGDLAFTRLATPLAGVSHGSTKWGDYDGDGDLDILLTGQEWPSGAAVSKVYRNDGNGNFVNIGAALWGVRLSSVDWGDHDNDGDLDIHLTGMRSGDDAPLSRVYRNNGSGAFVNTGAGLIDVLFGASAWGDYDSDGDLDILLTGGNESPITRHSKVYRNDGNGTFVDIAASLVGLTFGSAAWGDFDEDGDPDILLAGANDLGGYDSKVYRNDGGGVFVDIAAPLTGVGRTTARWGDADNDGDLDIFLAGEVGLQVGSSKLYTNQGSGTFTDSGVFIEPVWAAAGAWGDADNDGDLDLIESGGSAYDMFTALYRNDAAVANTPPASPGNLSAAVGAWSNGAFPVTFSWDAGSDAETSTPGLTYNLRVGHTPASNDVMPSMSSTGGFRRVVRRGNVDHNLSWTLHLPPGTYSWSVQTIDAAYAGSTFASKKTVVVAPVSVPEEAQNTTVALRAIEPNPFSAAATIEFEVARGAPVTLRVHDVSGRLVRTLIDGASWPAGRQSVTWDGNDANGRPAPAGIYLATIDIGGIRDQRRVARLR